MANFLLGSRILLLGLLLAQVLATLQVYLSNLNYFRALTALQAANYLVVPNSSVMATLRQFGPAFNGGLFFTLTAGASLTLLSFGTAWVWDRIFYRRKVLLVPPVLLLLFSLAAVNFHGFSPLITWYLLTIPVSVFLFTVRQLPEKPANAGRFSTIFPILSFLMVMLALFIWKPSQINMDRFLDVRDYLLLSNPVGQKINDFYYKNSLYSTQLFKSYGQQLIKTSRLDPIPDPRLKRRLTQILLYRDYLPVPDLDTPDLRVAFSDGNLTFHDRGKLIVTSPGNAFFRSPAEVLKRYETETDPHRVFRAITMISILLVGALVLYLLIFAPFYALSSLFLKRWPAAIKAGILCPLAIIALLYFVGKPDTRQLDNAGNLSEALTSPHLHTRIAGLKYILRNKVDMAEFPSYLDMMESGHIPERYWLAKALGVSRSAGTHSALHRLLEDPHFNVVCMALDSLGRRGQKADVRPILGKIKASENWYDQWYGYRALRRLGWKQRESK